MKYFVPTVIFLFLHLTSFSQSDTTKDKLIGRVLQKEQLQQDFTMLRKVLEETHPALYRYTPKAVMQKRMDSIADVLGKPMPFYDFYLLLTSLVVDIRCAHTSIIPKNDLRSYYMNETVLLPFEMLPIGDRLYITLNGTMDTAIKPGFEVLLMNNRTPKQIMQQLFRYMWADGYIQNSKIAQLSGPQFGFFYYAMVERPNDFQLTVRDLQGKVKDINIPALSYGELTGNFFKNPVNQQLISLYKPRNDKEAKAGWRLEILDEPNTALIRINGFGGGSNGKEAAKKMRDFMDKNIDSMKKKNIQNLVIDLRNNGGGWDIQGVELFTYLMKDTTPVRYFRRKHSITDSSEFLKYSDLSEEDKANVKKELRREVDGTFTVLEDYNDDLKIQYAKPNRFKGNVYFLINGGCGSTTSEFVAVAYSNKLGVFIGSESGGAYEGDNGGSFLHFDLPNSGIAIGTPLLYYDNEVKPRKLKGRGVIPDYTVVATIDDVLAARDTQLEKVIELIRKEKTK